MEEGGRRKGEVHGSGGNGLENEEQGYMRGRWNGRGEEMKGV